MLPKNATTAQKEAVIRRLREDEGLTFAAIGRQLGMKPQSAQQILARADAKAGREPPPVFRGSDPARVYHGAPAPLAVACPDEETGEAPEAPTGAPAAPTAGAVAHRIEIQAEARAGWQKSILVTSDHHFDHVDCDRGLLRYHLEQAAERGAGVLVLGDLFCAMQGKMDRRASKPELRPEYKVAGYLDAIVEDAAEWYAPFAPHLWLITYGNHETKVASYTETDILRRFWREMTRRPGGESLLLGSYAGWLSLDCTFPGGEAQRLRLRYHHGWGGGGPVTLGTIGTNRQAASADYDIYAQGHIHERWSVVRMRETVDDAGRMVTRAVPHICAGTYKAEGLRGIGWHVETGKPPKPTGGYWLHLYWSERQQAVLARTEEVEI